MKTIWYHQLLVVMVGLSISSLSANQIEPLTNTTKSIKLFRKKQSTTGSSLLGAFFGGTSFILFGTSFLADDFDTKASLRVCGGAGAAMMLLYIALLKSASNWNQYLSKPVVIFDDEGFTYEIEGFWKHPIDHRYAWKDIVRFWPRETYDSKYGYLIKKEWCFHVRGKPLITINLNMLNISPVQETEIESFLVGKLH